MAQWTQLMREAVRDLRIGGKIVFGSGREYMLSGDGVCALRIDEGADDALVPGSVLCAGCTMDLVNDEDQWQTGGSLLGMEEIRGATIMPEIGALNGDEMLWRSMGVFQVESAVYLGDEGILRLQASDSVAYELSDIFRDEMRYPCRLEDLWLYAVSQTRYKWEGQVPNGDALIDFAPEWKDATLRTALGCIACAAGCFVAIGRNGELKLCSIWNEEAPVHEMDARHYLKLEQERGHYGPVDSLRLKAVGAQEEQIYSTDGADALFALSVSENPLFRVDAPGLDALAMGMLSCVSGYHSAALRFEWRGDPEMEVGDRVCIRDVSDIRHEGIVARQTLQFSSRGFSMSGSCIVPEKSNSGLRRAITPEGWLNAAALTGAVDGALLSVGSVTTGKLAAGSITAEKIAAGALDTIALNAVFAKISNLTADDIQTDRLAAALAAFIVVTAGTASFDRAAISHLVAEAMHLEYGAANQVFIRNLAVEYAQMIGAAIGELCIRASDGDYYLLDVKPDGTVTAAKTTVSDDEINAGQTGGGKMILETKITAQQLNAGNLLAAYALINRIDAARIDVDQLFAREAFVSLLRTSRIVGDRSITMIAREAEGANRNFFQTEQPTGADLVRPGDTWTVPETGQIYQAEDASDLNLKFYLDADGGLHFEVDEGCNASFSVQGFDLYGDGLYFSTLEDGNLGTPYVWRNVRDRALVDAVNDAAIHEGEEPPEAPVKAGKLWIDRSAQPPVLRRWLGKELEADDPAGWETINDLDEINQVAAELAQRQEDIRAALDKLSTAQTLDEDGVHIYKPGYMNRNEVFIDEDSVDIRVGGELYSSFIPRGAVFGNYRIWQPEESGGLAFSLIDA